MSENSHGGQDEVAAQLEQLELEGASMDQPSVSSKKEDIQKSEVVVPVETVSSTVNNPSNNHQTPHERARAANQHQNVPEPEAEAVLRNNLNKAESDEDDKSTDLQEDVFMDAPEYTPEEEAERKARDAENKTRTDANNEKDVSTLRPSEASSYPNIESEKPTIPDVGVRLEDFKTITELKCHQLRWIYEEPVEKKMMACKGRDSLASEISKRMSRGIGIDDYARSCYEKYMKDWNLPGSEDDDENEPRKKVFVLNGYYCINENHTELVAEYWNERIKFERRIFFEKGNKLLDKDLHEAVYNFLRTRKPQAHIKFEFDSPDELVVTEEGNPPKIVTFYSEPAKWQDQCSEIKHVVFVVHGVDHQKDYNAVTRMTKRLIKGVDSSMETSSGIIFIPIHWRRLIESEGHICNKSCSQERDNVVRLASIFLKSLKDVGLYNCTVTGRKIRDVVCGIMNERYSQFIKNNEGFKGTVGILGHSLGSVISYDILTNFEGVTISEQDKSGEKLKFLDNVKRLFFVGSPLKRFIDRREKLYLKLNASSKLKSPAKQFRMVHFYGEFRISNIYHRSDGVADRFEPMIHRALKNQSPIDVEKLFEGKPQRMFTIRSKIKRIVSNKIEKSPVLSRLRYRIDYLVKNKSKELPHTCYTHIDDVYKLVRYAFEEVEAATDDSLGSGQL